jgi:phosphoglycolate phosphatase
MNQKTIKLVVLDFDGTLGNTYEIITQTMMKTLSTLNLEPRTAEQCSKMIGLPLKQCFKELVDISDEMAEKCAETYRKLFEELNKKGLVKLFPHVIETLQEIKARKIKIAIASSRNRSSLLRYAEDLKLKGLVDYIVGADDVEQAKPKPEPVDKILDFYGFAPNESMVVGDTKYDILMGKNAGSCTCGVTYGNGTLDELLEAGSDFIIDDFEGLLGLL